MLGAEAQASVGSQGEDWGWQCEHSLKGASAPQLARRESGKRSGAAEEARGFFLPLCFLVREERGFRAALKGAPETGDLMYRLKLVFPYLFSLVFNWYLYQLNWYL